jgi:uncharacterized membrane protein
MSFSDILKGKWLKHPLHPLLTHLPVALWPAALLFDLLSHLKTVGNIMVQLSFFSMVLGLVFAALAVPTGLADWSGVKKSNPAWRLGLYHMTLNLIVFLLFLLNVGLRAGSFRTDTEVSGIPLLLSALGTVFLFWSAHLGTQMIYDSGIGVARYSKKKWRRVAAAGGANVPEE